MILRQPLLFIDNINA